MKTAVRYQSMGGNTKAVAEIIAEAAGGVKAERADVPLNGPVDVLFVGGGVYAGQIGPSLKKFLKKLDPGSVKTLAAFSTSRGSDGAKIIAAAARAKGINVSGEALPLVLSGDNFTKRGGKSSFTLTEEQKGRLRDFVDTAAK